MKLLVDLSSDVGEGVPRDHNLFPYLSSASVGCGAHAGDADLTRRTISMAHQDGLGVGAHPGVPDRAGMGRAPLPEDLGPVWPSIEAQLIAFKAQLRQLNVPWQHVKPHGALYHRLAADPAAAATFVALVKGLNAKLWIFAPPESALARAAAEAGLPVAPELLADRGTRPDGTLIPRGEPGALVSSPAAVAQRVITHLQAYWAAAPADAPVPTACVHADTPNALEIVRYVRIALHRIKAEIQAPSVVRADLRDAGLWG